MLLCQKCWALRLAYFVPLFTVSVHIGKVNQLLQKEINLLPAFICLVPILGRRKEFQKSQGI